MWLLLLCVAGLFAATIAASVRIRSANSRQDVGGLAAADGFTLGRRILIVSPHPDDELLACGGLISRIRASGGEVRVVFLTNGDAYRLAAERETRRIKLTPQQLVSFGAARQQEAIKADSQLGLKPSDLVFLGFPDRGLALLWADNWSVPLTSRYTHVDHCPYALAWKKGGAYTGEELVSQLSSVIKHYRPAEILVPHPLDDHTDHHSAFAFTTAAMEQLSRQNPALTSRLRLTTFLVHRGDWPSPRARAPERFLAPPAGVSHCGTVWQMYPLRPQDIQAKERALACYRSQMALMAGFMRSFCRRNELFGMMSVPVIPRVADGRVLVDGQGDDWGGLSPQILDPVGDNVGRALREGADIKRMWLARDADNLYVRVDTEQSFPRASRMEILLRSFDGRQSQVVPLRFRAPDRISPPGTFFAWKGNLFEACIPLNCFPKAGWVWAGVSTQYLGFNIDKTGWRPMALDALPPARPVAVRESSPSEASPARPRRAAQQLPG